MYLSLCWCVLVCAGVVFVRACVRGLYLSCVFVLACVYICVCVCIFVCVCVYTLYF